jgi:hypothetical protein
MDEVGVHTDGENLAVLRLKIVMVFPQILQLRGTHEGEIRRVKEQNGPVSQKILPGVQTAFALAVAVDGKRFQRLSNQV